METNNKKYSRLPGKKRKFLGKDTLWAESDHILMVESSGMSEDYKRFYFKDIQSVSITRTLSAAITNSVLVVVIILFATWAAYLWKSLNAASAFPLIVASVCFFYLVINLLKGASCDCWLTTAVQRVKLTPVNRCRAAVKMLDIIGPKIEEHQGVITSDSLGEIIKKAETNQTIKNKIPATGQEKKILKRFYLALFVLCLFSALCETAFIFYHNFSTSIIVSLFGVVFAIVSIMTVVKQSQQKIKKSLKILPWGVIGLFIIDVIKSYAIMLMIMFEKGQNKEHVGNQIKLLQDIANINHFDYPMLLATDIFCIVVMTIISLTGLFLIRKNELS